MPGENVYLNSIAASGDEASVPIDAVISWFDSVKKVNKIKARTMAVIPSIERPLVAGNVTRA